MHLSQQRRLPGLGLRLSHRVAKLQSNVLLGELCLPVDCQCRNHGSYAVMMAGFLSRRKNPTRRWDEGAAAVEAAFILPVLILVIFGASEFGTAVWQWNKMLLAVEQAGRYAMVNNSYSTNPPGCTGTLASCTEAQMQNILSGASVCTTPTAGQTCVTALQSTTGSPRTMTLSANYSFNFFGLAAPFTISSQATVPLD